MSMKILIDEKHSNLFRKEIVSEGGRERERERGGERERGREREGERE